MVAFSYGELSLTSVVSEWTCRDELLHIGQAVDELEHALLFLSSIMSLLHYGVFMTRLWRRSRSMRAKQFAQAVSLSVK